MQLRSQQLEAHLKQQLAPCYLIAGDEPFLHQQASTRVRQAAKAAGFSERKVFHVDNSFNWEAFSAEYNSLSLFAAQRLIELRLQKSSLDKAAASHLHEALNNAHADICLLITMPKLSGSTKRSQWYKTFEQHKQAVVIHIWPLKEQQVPAWLQQYASTNNIQLSAQAAALLSQKNQGNLLAAAQEIDKLSLSFEPTQRIEAADVQAAQQNSQFSVFDLSYTHLRGQRKQAQLELQQLKLGGEEPGFILWALLRDLRLLAQCVTQQQRGITAQMALKKVYLPEEHKQALLQAAEHTPFTRIQRRFYYCLEIERAVKGLSSRDPWLLLERYLLH